MKTLNEYMQLPYRMKLVQDKDEGGYVVSLESAIRNAEDAKCEWIQAALEDGIETREPG